MEIGSQKLFESEVAGTTVSYGLSERVVTTDAGTFRRYGVSIETVGERADFSDIFSTADEARGFLAMLCRCQVTPVTLGDIVEDYICQ